MPRPNDVDTYIAAAPTAVRPRLRAVRAAIRAGAPEAIESLSYGMPFYRFPGESGVRARLCYFGRSRDDVVLYTRPAFLANHSDRLATYQTAKSALHFPPDRPIPLRLIMQLVRGAVREVRKNRRGGPGAPRPGRQAGSAPEKPRRPAARPAARRRLK